MWVNRCLEFHTHTLRHTETCTPKSLFNSSLFPQERILLQTCFFSYICTRKYVVHWKWRWHGYDRIMMQCADKAHYNKLPCCMAPVAKRWSYTCKKNTTQQCSSNCHRLAWSILYRLDYPLRKLGLHCWAKSKRQLQQRQPSLVQVMLQLAQYCWSNWQWCEYNRNLCRINQTTLEVQWEWSLKRGGPCLGVPS